ncbi:FG-GAP-like repeat-containing protein [Plantactinospora sp. KLBMP9567]|uniref:FG-GAP-like repeat-containing protein n=1 Tax=Plantactinospora sp. KLBMP9567 TaxID=3085900 RepID=UPI0029826DBA|nr:FG-GAP-like repeat-containing protein [Plantactinospora sp. KLBMP9567]MDW5328857.1 FG-GAP-like repeat-containing protein [Plantactinospora sp. KLBMP9567]
MWRRRLAAAILSVVLTGTLGIAVAPAHAGGTEDPIWGDLNNDGKLDRITLGDAADGERCGVGVRWGGAGTVVEHPYVPPGATLPTAGCPDLGTAVDLGGDGTDELVVGWFSGPPTGVGSTLLILRNFVPELLGTERAQPSEISRADFNGDGLTDIYWWSDHHGIRTFLNTPTGQLVPGPIQQDHGSINHHQLADFDGNGAMDIVLAFHGASSLPATGAVVIFDDGAEWWLEQGDDDDGFSVEVVDPNADGRPDVRSENGRLVTYFTNRGNRTFHMGPVANDDRVQASRNTPKVIKVRDNDIAGSDAVLTIVVPPRYGFLSDHDPRHEVVYQRTDTHSLPDTFVYRLGDGLGDTATVTVRMKD